MNDNTLWLTTIFTLVGRPIRFYDDTRGIIVAQVAAARYAVLLADASVVEFDRCEFKLPPLPKERRRPTFVSEWERPNFVYANEPEFVNPFARQT